MSTTRSKLEEMVSHLLENVMAQAPGSTLHLAFNEILVSDLLSLMDMEEGDVRGLSYTPKYGTPTPVHRAYCRLTKAMRSFLHYKQSIGKNCDLSTTKQKFDKY